MTPLNVALVCVFLQVGLTFWAIFQMGLARVRSVRAKDVSVAEAALGQADYPTKVVQLQNNAHNQFETPNLLFAAVAIAAATGAVNWGLAIGAVIYITSRFVHRAIHVGNNRIGRRFYTYLVGLIALVICWVSLGFGLIF